MSEKTPTTTTVQMTWFVSEKIHGCNVSFYCDGKEIKIAKRTGFVTDPTTFLNYSTWLSSEKHKIYKLGKDIIIYG